MKIEVKKVVTDEAGSTRLEFDSPLGQSVAIWGDEACAPAVGASYDVELDVDEPVRVGKNAAVALEGQASLRHENGNSVVTGIVEQVFDDGTVALRVGISLATLNISGASPREGQTLAVTTQRLRVLPFFDEDVPAAVLENEAPPTDIP